MTAHKHAENMRLYYEDALETTMPWLRWEMKGDGCKDFVQLHSNPHFDTATEYRRKPKTIKIGERDVPAPMRVAPAMNSEYCTPLLLHSAECSWHNWRGDTVDMFRLGARICHATPEAAIAHAEALILISGGTLR